MLEFIKGKAETLRDKEAHGVASEALINADIEVDHHTKTVEVIHYLSDHPEVYDYFRDVPGKLLTTRFGQVVLVGALALKGAGTTEKIDYIEKHFTAFQSEFEQKVREYLGEEGRVGQLMDRYLGERGKVREFIDDFLGEDGKIVKELLDPSKKDSPLGKLQGEMVDQFVKLREDLHVQEAEGALEERTTVGGHKFEDVLEEMLSDIVRPFSDRLERTSEAPGLLEGNKTGDFVITLGDRPDLRLTIEAKKTKTLSSPKVEEIMVEALKNRDAGYGILVSRDVEALPQSIRWFAERKGKHSYLVVALGSREVGDHLYREILEVAYRWARMRLTMQRAEVEGIDTEVVERRVEKAHRAIQRFSRIRRQCTNAEKAVKAIRKELNGVQGELEEILDDITDEIESAAAR